MALLYIDGFEHYGSSQFLNKFSDAQSISHLPNGGRRNGGALYSSNYGYFHVVVPSTSSFVIGLAYYASSFPAFQPLIRLYDASDGEQCNLSINSDGTISIVRGDPYVISSVVLGTSTETLFQSAWNYIEWKVTIANSISADSCVVHVNGAEVLNVASGSDTQFQSGSAATKVGFYAGLGYYSGVYKFDDLYICDQSGSANNDFLGDCRVDLLVPNEDGSYADGTPSTGTDHYACVDERPPSNSDYVTLASVGDRDSYGFTDLPALSPATIYGVQANAYWYKDDAGSRSAAVFARSGTTDEDRSSIVLPSSAVYRKEIFEVDPDTSSAWTQSGVNAAEFGVKVTA